MHRYRRWNTRVNKSRATTYTANATASSVVMILPNVEDVPRR
jgi:hypothetical protein